MLPQLDASTRASNAAVLIGARADAHVTIDGTEHSRRAEAGLRSVTDLAVLDALLDLPAHVPVEAAQLTPDNQVQLRRAPAGVVDVTPTTFTRLLRPPARVDLVLVEAKTWRKAVQRAAEFAAFAPCALVVPKSPSPSQRLEADALGLGIQLHDQTVLAAAQPMQPRLKAVTWRFRENAYERWLTGATV